MTRIGDFQAAGLMEKSGRVVVDDQGKVSTANWKGSAVSFFKGNYKAENNRAKAAFVKSMKSAYGSEVADKIALKLNMNDGKPLKMRQVKQLLAEHVNIQRQPTPLQKGDVNLLIKANGLIKGGQLVLTEGDYSTLGNLSLSVGNLKSDSPLLDKIVLTSDERLAELVGECLKEANPTPADIAKVVKAIRQGLPNYVSSDLQKVVVNNKVYTNPVTLAAGANGKAVRYTTDQGKSIVVKYATHNDEEDVAKASREVQIHRYANDGKGPGSENVAKLIAPIRTGDNQIAIVLENCELGDVSKFPAANGPVANCLAKGLITPGVAKKVKLQMISDLLKGVAYLQNERNMVHLDLKPGNIFMNGSGELKIADFGEGATTMGLVSSDLIGTPAYMAPEMDNAKGEMIFDNKMDSYSVGFIIYELVTGKRPFFDDHKWHKEAAGARDDWFQQHNGLAEGDLSTGDRALDDLINGLTNRNRDDRLAMDEALQSPIFNSIKANGQELPELRQLAAAMAQRESLEKAVAQADSASKPAAQQALADHEADILDLSSSVRLR